MRRGWLRSNRRQTLGQRGPAGYPPRVLLLILNLSLLWWSLGAEALNRESAKPPGRFCPAFLLSAAALVTATPAWRRNLPMPARSWVIFSDQSSYAIHSSGWAWAHGELGWMASVLEAWDAAGR